jgi:hypothetical protein
MEGVGAEVAAAERLRKKAMNVEAVGEVVAVAVGLSGVEWGEVGSRQAQTLATSRCSV